MHYAVQTRILVLLAVLLGGFAVIFVYSPGGSTWYPKCIFHEATGLYCTGCGATRALHALVHGRIVQAMGYNIFFVLALPWLVWHLFFAIRQWVRIGRFQVANPGRYTSIFLVCAVLGFTVLRNLPWFPFSILAP